LSGQSDQSNIKRALARLLSLIAVMLATKEAEIRRMEVRSQPGQVVLENLSRKYQHKRGLAEWLKCTTLLQHLSSNDEALNSNPSTTKKKKQAYI
jgi:hypothetical protein